MSENDKPKHGRPRQVIWNGVEYASIQSASRALGIPHSTMRQRIGNGHACDEDLHTGKPCFWEGRQYKSISEASRSTGVPKSTISRYLANSWHSRDASPTKHNGSHRPCMWNGNQYSSIAEAAMAPGISREAMRQRLNKGYVCDDDIKLPHNAKLSKESA